MPSKRPKSQPSKSKKTSSSDPDPEPPNRPDSSPPAGADHKNPNPKNRKPSTSQTPNPAPSPDPKSPKKPKPSKMPKAPDPTDASSAAAADADADADAASPRKSQRKRKAREFPDEEAPTAAAAAGGGGGGKGVSSLGSQRRWTDEDAVALLRGVLDFRVRTGATPTGSTLAPFFNSVKASLPSHITQDQVYNKLRHLRHKYLQTSAHGPHDTPFYKLATGVWGAEGKKANGATEENGDVEAKDEAGSEENDASEGGEGATSYPLLTPNMVEYCRKSGLSEEVLEVGLKLVDPAKARALEGKWQRQSDTELKLQVKRCDLNKELLMVLGAALRGTGS